MNSHRVRGGKSQPLRVRIACPWSHDQHRRDAGSELARRSAAFRRQPKRSPPPPRTHLPRRSRTSAASDLGPRSGPFPVHRPAGPLNETQAGRTRAETARPPHPGTPAARLIPVTGRASRRVPFARPTFVPAFKKPGIKVGIPPGPVLLSGSTDPQASSPIQEKSRSRAPHPDRHHGPVTTWMRCYWDKGDVWFSFRSTSGAIFPCPGPSPPRSTS